MPDFGRGEYTVDQDRPFEPAKVMMASACPNIGEPRTKHQSNLRDSKLLNQHLQKQTHLIRRHIFKHVSLPAIKNRQLPGDWCRLLTGRRILSKQGERSQKSALKEERATRSGQKTEGEKSEKKKEKGEEKGKGKSLNKNEK